MVLPLVPILGGIVIRSIIRWAIRRGLQEVMDMAKDAIVRQIMDRASKYAEEMLLAKAKEQCPTCDPKDYLSKLDKPCSLLANGNPAGAGRYRGGSYAGNKRTRPPGTLPGSTHGHHVPAKANYPSWNRLSLRERDRAAEHWPSINMDSGDHERTLSHPKNALNPVYNRVQKVVFRKHGILGAFALDVASIKLAHGDKYDQALIEAGAYAACVAMFPKKYDIERRR